MKESASGPAAESREQADPPLDCGLIKHTMSGLEHGGCNLMITHVASPAEP